MAFSRSDSLTLYFVKRAEQIYNLAFKNISKNELKKIEIEVLKKLLDFLNSDLGTTVSKDFNVNAYPSGQAGLNAKMHKLSIKNLQSQLCRFLIPAHL